MEYILEVGIIHIFGASGIAFNKKKKGRFFKMVGYMPEWNGTEGRRGGFKNDGPLPEGHGADFRREGFSPEGHGFFGIKSIDAAEKCMERGDIIEAPVTLCDHRYNLHVTFGDGLYGIIPREESQYTDGEPIKDIAILTRVGKQVAVKITAKILHRQTLQPIPS